MIVTTTLKLIILLIITSTINGDSEIDLSFPKSFLIGAASSSHQIEGAWNVDGKSENVWDHFTHTYPKRIADNSTADISCDSYHKYKEDIQLVKDIGLNHYRFSLSWSRILPSGDTSQINKKGISYYHKVLDELEKQNIIPFVTIYHWDHPLILEQFGGWLNEEMAYMFAEYARFIFKEFGHRVKFFSTINEPYMLCTTGYQGGQLAPGAKLKGFGEYQCLNNVLKAHALAYHIYDQEFRSQQNGQLGIVIPAAYGYGDPKSMDINFEFNVGSTANPIFSKEGDYPEVMKQMIDKRSKLQGYEKSRLPVLTKEWIDYIKGTYDYFGLNHYSSMQVQKLPDSEMLNWPDDSGLNETTFTNLAIAQIPIFNPYPKGFGDILRKIKDKYNNPPVYILENGVPDGGGTNDVLRSQYMYSYMKEMLVAMKSDGCDVRSYTIWSLLDSFEWNSGYTAHFGLYQVDMNDPERKRSPKKSVGWLKRILKDRKLESPTSR